MRLYRGAQRLLALEEQLLGDVLSEGEGELAGPLSIGASTGPAAVVVPQLLCEFQHAHPGVRVALEVHDTRTVVELVSERRLELGSWARLHAIVPFASSRSPTTRSCSSARRATALGTGRRRRRARLGKPHRDAGGGRRTRRVVEDELRRLGLRLRDLDLHLELGLQESVRSAVLAGYGVTFISRAAVEAELACRRARGGADRGHGREARDLDRPGGRAGADTSRGRLCGIRPRAGGRGRRRARTLAGVQRGRIGVSAEGAPARIVRFGAGSLGELGGVCAEVGITRPLLVTTRSRRRGGGGTARRGAV